MDLNSHTTSIPVSQADSGIEKVNIDAPSSKNQLCKHTIPSCIINTLRAGLRGFLIGFGIRGTIGLLTAIFLQRAYNSPQKLVKGSILHKETLNMALFLGTYNLSFKGISCLLRNFRKKDDGVNSFIAGGIAGFSMLFWKSSEVALYLFARALESVFNGLVSRGYVKSYYHGDSLLFALATSIMFYAFIWEPKNLRPSYNRFLMKMSNGRDIDRSAAKALGMNV